MVLSSFPLWMTAMSLLKQNSEAEEKFTQKLQNPR